MKAIFIFSFYFGIFEINYIICKFFFKEQNCVKENTIFWKIQEYFILDIKISKSINYCTNMCGSAFALHKSKVLKQF
jgi:hypothetical protein